MASPHAPAILEILIVIRVGIEIRIAIGIMFVVFCISFGHGNSPPMSGLVRTMSGGSFSEHLGSWLLTEAGRVVCQDDDDLRGELILVASR